MKKRKYTKSGYIYFFQEKRTDLAVQMSLECRRHTDAVREIGKMWKLLSIEEKNKYNELAKIENNC